MKKLLICILCLFWIHNFIFAKTKKEIKEAEKWLNKANNTENVEDRIVCCTKAISLNSNYLKAYNLGWYTYLKNDQLKEAI